MATKTELSAGHKVGRLTLLNEVTFYAWGAQRVGWNCACECGGARNVTTGHLESEHTRSCGCLSNARLVERRVSHGAQRESTDPILRSMYNTWMNIRARCLKKDHRQYPDYGGRGITVCDRWQESFENFISDVGLKPGAKYSLDRINNNGNYEPGNVRWATYKQQVCEQLGKEYKHVIGRIYRGWSLEDAFFKAKRRW
jgi:hypothetical protein